MPSNAVGADPLPRMVPARRNHGESCKKKKDGKIHKELTLVSLEEIADLDSQN